MTLATWLRSTMRKLLGFAVLASVLTIGDFSFADDGKAKTQRLLLIGQGPDGSHKPTTHEYFAGVQLVGKLLRGQPNLETVAVSADGAWSDGPQLLERADAAVLFVAEGAKWVSADAARLAAFRDFAKRGGGLSVLHWGTGTKTAEPIAAFVQLFGACHGGPDRKFVDWKETTVLPELVNSTHPILRGVKPFTEGFHEEFYFKLKQPSKNGGITNVDSESVVTPLLRVPFEDERHTVSWCWERPDGGRSFGLTGLHYHANWKYESYRRLIAQAVLWTLKRDVPTAGLDVSVSENDLTLPATKP